MASTNLTNATVAMTISTSTTIGAGTGGTSSSGRTGVVGSGGAGGTGRMVGGAVGSSSGGASCASSNVGSSGGGNIGGVSSSVGGSGSGSTSISGGISTGGVIGAISPGSSAGCGSGAGSSVASGSASSSAGSSGGPGANVPLTYIISPNEINWYRIGSLLYNGILPAMLSVLHNDNSDPYTGLPRDPTALYNELMKRKPVIDKLAGKPSGPKIINKDQLQVIYPKTKTTDSGEFDITLTVILIRNLLKLPKPQARWDRPVKPNDSTMTANIMRGQQIRNFFSHHKPDTIDSPTLDSQYNIGERILKELKYTKCDTKALKTELIDGRTYSMIMSFTQKEKDRLDNLEAKVDVTGQEIVSVESRVSQKIDEVKVTADDVEVQMNVTNQKVGEVEVQMNVTNQKIDEVEMQMNATNQKIDEVEVLMNANNQKVEEVEVQMNANNQKVEEVEVQMNATNQKVDEVEVQMNATNQKVEVQLDVTNKRVNEVKVETNATNQKVDEVEHRVKDTEQRLDAFNYRMEKLEDSFGESSKSLTEDSKVVERADKIMSSQSIPSDAVVLKRLDETFVNILLEDDGISHFHFIQNTNWSIWTHHSRNSNPSEILHSFERSEFIPNEITCQLYECGYTKHYTEHEMDEHHLRKFRRLFSEDMKNQPWLLTNLHVDCVKSLQFYEFLEKLRKWCTNKEYSFMLLNYSCEEHLQMLNVNLDELRLSLQISQLGTENEHILVYVATDDILMNIRFVSSSGSESENKTIINQAILEGQNDVKLFSCLHMFIFKDFNVTLVSVTVLNNMNRIDLPESVCTKCSDTIVITQDEWLKENVLQRKLDTIVEQKRQISKENETSKYSCSVGDCFERFSSRLWGWLCTKDVYLPNMSIHGSSCLARIYLNSEQLRFMHLKQCHLMLKGPYGSGKSIMGMTKFRDLALKATSTSCLYFICCSSNTMYTALMKSRLHEMLKGYLAENQLIVLNLDEYAQQFGLQEPVMVSDILQDMGERHKKRTSAVGVIFDEYDASYLTEQEACRLDKARLTLKDSYILILCQSMETTRTKVIKERSGLMTKKNKMLYDAFMFGSTSMQIETFNMTMRNCTRVNKLSRVATGIIENAPNEYFERETIDYEKCQYTDDSIIFDPTTKKKDEVKSLTKETNKESMAVNLEPGTKDTSLSSDKEIHPESGSKNYPQRRNENETLIVSGLFDHLVKNLGNTSKTYTGVCIKSTFKFPGKWMNGHSVEGDIPQLIYPFGNDNISYDNVNLSENKVRIGFALQSLIAIPTRLGNIGVICFDPIDAQLFHNVLVAMDLPVKLYAPMLFPTHAAEVAPDLRECAKSHIVITDHVGAQGLELNQLIVSIDPNEKYVHQYLVEAITRCINSLFIFFIPKQTTAVKEKGGATKKIVDDWMRNNLVHVSKVTFCKVHQKNEIESTICKDEKKKGKKTYRIHLWHESFDSYTAIHNCEVIHINTQRLVEMSKIITNTHHIQEVMDKKSFSYIANSMEKMDLKSFASKYKTKQLKKIRGTGGETLLDVAREKSLMDYVAWLKSIGVQGLPVTFQYHRGPRGAVTVEKDNSLHFRSNDSGVGWGNWATVAAPELAFTTGAKVMYEVTFHSLNSTLCRIGWATPEFRSDAEGGRGRVGQCTHSYSYCPFHGSRDHNNPTGGPLWGVKVTDGNTTQVLGIAADLQNKTLLYAWDGKWDDGNMGVAFAGLPPDIVLYPVMSSYGFGATLKVNFGDTAFKFRPPDSSFRSIRDATQ